MYVYATTSDGHHKGRSLVNLERANGVHIHQHGDNRFTVLAINDFREGHQMTTAIAVTTTLQEAVAVVDRIACAMKAGEPILDLCEAVH
jgi:hypothetical protein